MTGSKVPIGQDVNGRLVRSTVERGEVALEPGGVWSWIWVAPRASSGIFARERAPARAKMPDEGWGANGRRSRLNSDKTRTHLHRPPTQPPSIRPTQQDNLRRPREAPRLLAGLSSASAQAAYDWVYEGGAHQLSRPRA